MKRNIKRSIVWLTPKEELQKILDESSTQMEVLVKLNLNPISGNHRTLQLRFKEENFDLSKFETNKQKRLKENIEKLKNKSTIPDQDVFVKNGSFSRKGLKMRLINNGFEYKCSECGQLPEWNGKPLTLQLDHINGINNDNRIENLRFLCPHCHSQTSNYSGKSLKKYNFCKCGNEIKHGSETCKKCVNKKQKIDWPQPQDLQTLLWQKPTVQIAKELGVSDKAVEKFCKKHNLTKPPRGYWLTSKRRDLNP